MEQLGFEFLSASEWTDYPFSSITDDSLRTFVIDASITVEASHAGANVAITKLTATTTSPRSVEVSVGPEILIPDTAPVSSVAFGAYELWTVANENVELRLVVLPNHADVVFAGSAVLVTNAINAPTSGTVLTILADGDELAVEGGVAALEPGSHMSVTIEDGVIELAAEYQAGDCAPSGINPAEFVTTINGVGPDEYGNVQLKADKGWEIYRKEDQVVLSNMNKACCDCDDYDEAMDLLVESQERLRQVLSWHVTNQSIYRRVLSYVKFLNRTTVVGSPDRDVGEPSAGDADC